MPDADLLLADDPRLRRAARGEWLAERLGWVLMAAALTAGLGGWLGPSRWTQRRALSADGRLEVSYFAVERAGARTELLLRARSEQSELVVELDQSFVEGSAVESIVPEPIRSELRPDGVRYVFRGSPGPGPQAISFRLSYVGDGPLRFRATLDDRSPVDVSTFILP